MKALKVAVIVMAAFILFIATVHDATIQSPPVEIYSLLEVDTDETDGTEICNEFICCTFEKILLIRSNGLQ